MEGGKSNNYDKSILLHTTSEALVFLGLTEVVCNYIMGKFVDNVKITWIIILNFIVFSIAIFLSFISLFYKVI